MFEEDYPHLLSKYKAKNTRDVAEEKREIKVQFFYFYWQIEALYYYNIIYTPQGSLHQSTTLTSEVNNTEYLITKAPVRQWDVWSSMWIFCHHFWTVGSKKNGRLWRSARLSTGVTLWNCSLGWVLAEKVLFVRTVGSTMWSTLEGQLERFRSLPQFPAV